MSSVRQSVRGLKRKCATGIPAPSSSNSSKIPLPAQFKRLGSNKENEEPADKADNKKPRANRMTKSALTKTKAPLSKTMPLMPINLEHANTAETEPEKTSRVFDLAQQDFCAEFETTVEELLKKRLTASKHQYTERIKQGTDLVKELRKTLNELRKRKDNFVAGCTSIEEQIQEEMEEFKESVSESLKEKEITSKELQEARKTLKDLNEKLETLQKSKETVDSDLIILQVKYEQLKDSKQVCEEEIAGANSKINDLEANLEFKITELQKIEASLELSKQNLAETQVKAREELAKTKELLNSEVEQNRQKLFEANQSLTQLKEVLSTSMPSKNILKVATRRPLTNFRPNAVWRTRFRSKPLSSLLVVARFCAQKNKRKWPTGRLKDTASKSKS